MSLACRRKSRAMRMQRGANPRIVMCWIDGFGAHSMSSFRTLQKVTLKRRLRICWLVLALPAAVALGEPDAAGAEPSSAGGSAVAEPAIVDAGIAEPASSGEDGLGGRPQAVAPRLKVGMSLEEALEVLGKSPDSQSEIGAACGKLDVLTWDEDGTRLISVDGTISSVVDGGDRQEQ